MHYFIPHLLLHIFFYCVRLITNRASEFLTNFIIREGIEKDGLKTRRILFDKNYI